MESILQDIEYQHDNYLDNAPENTDSDEMGKMKYWENLVKEENQHDEEVILMNNINPTLQLNLTRQPESSTLKRKKNTKKDDEEEELQKLEQMYSSNKL